MADDGQRWFKEVWHCSWQFLDEAAFADFKRVMASLAVEDA